MKECALECPLECDYVKYDLTQSTMSYPTKEHFDRLKLTNLLNKN